MPFGLASRGGLGADVTVVPVELAKGLELDGVVLVEPATVVAEERQGLRALYVALTRATRRLAIVHADPLPEALVDAVRGERRPTRRSTEPSPARSRHHAHRGW